MPPVVTPAQGSRSGLIFTVIASIVLAVAMIVVAVYFSQAATKAEKDLADRKLEERAMYQEGAASDPDVVKLQDLSKNPGPFQGLPALEASVAQSKQLAGIIGGSSAAQAAEQADSTLKRVSKQLDELNSQKLIDFTVPANSSLSSAMDSMAKGINNLVQAKKKDDDQIAELQKNMKQQVDSSNAALADRDKQIAQARADAEAKAKELADYQQQVTAATNAVSQTGGAKLSEVQAANAALTTQLQQANKKNSADQSLIDQLQRKLNLARVNPSEAIVQQPKGNIVRVVDQNTCFINVGARQSVIKGLTFEVYDKNKGIPPLGKETGDTNLPVGKASIEVVAVQTDTSECRIIKTEPGQQIVIGDVISNLVFDPNTKYSFVVYGDFDLTNSGQPSANDTEIIKRLITQWGGKIQDHVDVNTDFVVMGVEPTLPTITDPNNPGDVIRRRQAEERQKKYYDVVTEAGKLSIPVMNQNRFLYFIGYYDQARR